MKQLSFKATVVLNFGYPLESSVENQQFKHNNKPDQCLGLQNKPIKSESLGVESWALEYLKAQVMLMCSWHEAAGYEIQR